MIVENPLAGIIRLVAKIDPARGFEEIELGDVETLEGFDDLFPQIGGLAAANRRNIFSLALWQFLRLKAEFELSVILSVSPATPPSRRRFLAVRTELPDGTGPEYFSHIPAGFCAARYAWSDAKAEDIIGAIKGLTPGGWQALDSLLLNPDHVLAVHKANVRRVQDLFRSRAYGGVDVPMRVDLEPTGALSEIRQISARGAMVTQLRFSETPIVVELQRFLDPAVRAALNKIMIERPETP